MAFYEYVCDDCHEEFEVKKKMSESDRVEYCPHCTGMARRIFNPTHFTWGKGMWEWGDKIDGKKCEPGLGDDYVHNF